MSSGFSDDLLKGIDVSKYQRPGTIDWASLRELDYTFVIVRAEYGVALDRHALTHIRDAGSEGFALGAYGWHHGGITALLDLYATHQNMKIAPSLDVEEAPKKEAPLIFECCDEIREAFGKGQLYTSQYYWHMLGNPAWPRDFSLWASHYGVRHPALPKADGAPQDWLIWQHEGREPLSGEAGSATSHQAIDQNVGKPALLTVPDLMIDAEHVRQQIAMTLAQQMSDFEVTKDT